MSLTKTLIHLHTNYSFDANIAPEVLARFAEREGIGCIAVTDHDTIEGARHLARITDIRVIIGEEVTTRDGDVIGLFLDRRVEPGLSARETALAIREQGGLVLVPHPFIRVLGRGLGEKMGEIADLIDAVEVCNAQNCLALPDRRARRFAEAMNLVPYVGSDSHVDTSIAPCYQMMSDFDGPGSFLAALRSATLVPGRHPLSYFAAAAYRTARYLAGLPLPAGFGANHAASPAPVRATAGFAAPAATPG